MTHTEITNLMAENMRIMGRLSSRLNAVFEDCSNKTRQQMSVLVRLYLAGKIKLKDFANREVISTANLCSVFKKLEQDKLVMRSIDPNDHRDTWYEVTKAGKNLAEKLIDKFMLALEGLCKVLPTEDEDKLAETVKIMNGILKKMEVLNA
ncbi:MAG: MarR family transcriptional regulator [Alphaproteobacteria bacterium]|nr:MarR family transcriptional regulator [Alphaproteobacteria bacterium]